MANTFEKGLALGLAMGGLSVTTKVAPPPEPAPVEQMMFFSPLKISFQGYIIKNKPLYLTMGSQGCLVENLYYGEKIVIQEGE